MRIRKSLIHILALALVVAFSSLAKVQAASPADPGLRHSAGQLVATVKATTAHKAGARHHHRHVAGKGKGPGSCGTYMYYSGKTHKCMDARAK